MQIDEVRLFPVVCSDRTRSNDLKLECRKFCTNMWKNLFMVRAAEHWSLLVESPSMEILNICLDAYLRDLL